MSTTEQTGASASYIEAAPREYEETPGDGWVLFAGTMLAMVGTLNVIDGIAVISQSTFFTESALFVISDLNTFGWVVLILGTVQVHPGRLRTHRLRQALRRLIRSPAAPTDPRSAPAPPARRPRSLPGARRGR